MAIYQLQETDTGAVDGTIAACSGLSAGPATDNRTATKGGTPGTSTPLITCSTQVAPGQSLIQFETAAGELDVLTCPAGNYTVRVNITTAFPAGTNWITLYICLLDKNGATKATISTNTGLGISVSSTGVKSVTVSGTQQTLAAGDRIYFALGFTNGTIGSKSGNYTPNQLIDTPLLPIVSGGPILVLSGPQGVGAPHFLQPVLGALIVASGPPGTPVTWYLWPDEDVGGRLSSFGSLKESPNFPPTGIVNSSWSIAGVPVGYASKYFRNQLRPASSFTTTAEPDGVFDIQGDALRTQNQYTGTFAPGIWTVFLSLAFDSGTPFLAGDLRFRVFRGSNPNGSGAVELTTSTQAANINAGSPSSIVASVRFSWTLNSPATFSGEFLFFELALKLTNLPAPQGNVWSLYQGQLNAYIISTPFVGTSTAVAKPQAFAGALIGPPMAGSPWARPVDVMVTSIRPPAAPRPPGIPVVFTGGPGPGPWQSSAYPSPWAHFVSPVPPTTAIPATSFSYVLSGPPMSGPMSIGRAPGFVSPSNPPPLPAPPIVPKWIPTPINTTLIPTVPSDDNRLERFSILVSQIMNSLMRQGILGRTDPNTWALILAASVNSFNTRTGAITLSAADVTTALGYTPVTQKRLISAGQGLAGGGNLEQDIAISMPPIATAGSFTLASITIDAFGRVTSASTGTAVASFNSRTGAVTLTSSDVTTALGSTPLATLFTGTASVTVGNTNVETSLMPTGQGSLTLAANYLVAGKTIRFRAKGFISTTAVPGNLTFNFKVGGVTVASTGAFAAVGSLTNLAWDLEVELTCRTTGVGGTSFVQGRFLYEVAAVGADIAGLVNTSASTIDTTISEAIDLSVTWGTQNASNTMTLTNASLEGLN